MTAVRAPWRRRLGRAGRLVAIAVVLVVFLLPFGWMLLASLKRQVDITSGNPWQGGLTLENYRTVFERYPFLGYTINSLVVAAWATVLSLLVGLPAAYAMARYRMRRTALVILVARMAPGIGLVTPWYIVFNEIGLTGSYPALILSHMLVAVPFVVWVMMNFFDALPIELEESAMLDGLSQAGAFLRIAVRLAVPGVVTSAILSFIFSWNNFLFSLVLADKSTRTLPVAIFNFVSYASIDWGGLMAASVAITVPVLVISLFVQRYIVAGLTSGATK